MVANIDVAPCSTRTFSQDTKARLEAFDSENKEGARPGWRRKEGVQRRPVRSGTSVGGVTSSWAAADEWRMFIDIALPNCATATPREVFFQIRKREKNKKIKNERGLGDRAWPSIFIAKCILIQDPRDFHPMLNMYVVLTTSSPQLPKA
jgi:hypothetical protein